MPDSNQSTSNNSASPAVTTASTELPEVKVEDGLTSDSNSISELFFNRGRDPSKWTPEDMAAITKHVRDMRKNLEVEKVKGTRKPAAAKKAPPEVLGAKTGVDLLKSLGLK